MYYNDYCDFLMDTNDYFTLVFGTMVTCRDAKYCVSNRKESQKNSLRRKILRLYILQQELPGAVVAAASMRSRMNSRKVKPHSEEPP